MKTLIKIAAVAAIVVASVSAMAQQQGGGGGGGFGGGGGRQGRGMRGMMGGMGMDSASLLSRDDVREDIVLTDDEKDKLKDLQDAIRAKRRAAMEEMRNNGGGGGGGAGGFEAMRTAMEKMAKENDAEVAKILTADQNKRLREIKIQLAGRRAVAMDDVATDLGLTDDQKSKIKTLVEQADGATRAVFMKIRGGDVTMEQAMDTAKKNNETLATEIDKVLTDAQKTKLADMGGKKFEEKPAPGNN